MNILAIGAHFDDIELGCGGSIAKHTAKGDKVYIYVATTSGYSDYAKQAVRDNDVALNEGKNAAKILGAEVTRGNCETLKLEFNDELNIDIIKLIEEKKIDQIYTHWHGDIHHDHAALSKATLQAGRHVKRILMYRSNWYQSPTDFRGNFYIDITETWHIKEKAIQAHESEYKRVGEKWLSFFKNEAQNAGQRIGVPLAEVFELIKWIE
ncbi:MAG TPA: PIG-L family deacetylase [Candidatus Gastranaerophilales bacterium]|nr:PIG-L family deacetylase [Candidatus Gastranaerophilales bacterium]